MKGMIKRAPSRRVLSARLHSTGYWSAHLECGHRAVLPPRGEKPIPERLPCRECRDARPRPYR
jgi:hypothetical protein